MGWVVTRPREDTGLTITTVQTDKGSIRKKISRLRWCNGCGTMLTSCAGCSYSNVFHNDLGAPRLCHILVGVSFSTCTSGFWWCWCW
ncbi:MAG: hypothetical protein DRO11_07665 [Methanobacteriota archaeon]|nr:MAG: hypothetical protein DRO11_07665 [Euryarchaeota archaeon]